MSYSSAFWSTLKITRFQLCVNEATKKVLKSGNFQSLTRNLSYSSFFSVLCPDLKIHWASSEVLEVTRSFSRSRRPNFLILSVFNEFSFRIFVVLSFEVVWPQQPQKGLFQKLHFWYQYVPTKMMRYIILVKILLNLSTEDLWIRVSSIIQITCD